METITMKALTDKLEAMSVGEKLYIGLKEWDGDPTVIRIDCLNPLGNLCWLISFDEGAWLATDGAYTGPLEFQLREWLESINENGMEYRPLYYGCKAQELCDYFTDRINDSEWASRPMWLKNDMDEHVGGLFQEGDKWIAFDNTTGDNWVEEFKTELEALMWIYDYND